MTPSESTSESTSAFGSRESTDRPVSLIIAGAGGRGTGYAEFASMHPDRVIIAGVAEPRRENREHLAKTHSIPPERCFSDWREAAREAKFADGVIIATQDAMHLEPAIEFAEKGYHLLLEKPMAPSEDDCVRIVEAVKRCGVMLAVGHVMRYTDYTTELKRLLDSGAIGDIASVEHLEPVGYWHQAHSFVRGNWRNADESSPMLLSKSCHDLDWLRYIIGKPCRSVASFGSLLHFRKECKPAPAGDARRCTECAFERECPYSAVKIYMDRVRSGRTGWPVSTLSHEVSEKTVAEAIETGPYGRCVYECDNNVVDHQVVSLEFEGGVTASFTMTAFTEAGHRKTRIFGTRGMVEGDGVHIRRFDFLGDSRHEIDTTAGAVASDGSIIRGHGGGDYGLMNAFVTAIARDDPSRIRTGPDESLETHRMVFRAERARLERKTISI